MGVIKISVENVFLIAEFVFLVVMELGVLAEVV
jgi:hypothetical protein